MAKVASWLVCFGGLMIMGNAFPMDRAERDRCEEGFGYGRLDRLMNKIQHPDTSVAEVELLASKMNFVFYSFKAGEHLYECGRKYGGRSPSDGAEKNQHFGNKAVVDYVFCEMLSQKLEKLAAKER